MFKYLLMVGFLMLKRLSLEGLEVRKEHVSVVDVYCSEGAKRNLEVGYKSKSWIPITFFDRITQMIIGPEGNINPILLPEFGLIERTEVYGINGNHIPDKALADVFEVVFMDTSMELSDSQILSPKYVFLKPVYYSGQIGREFQLEFEPELLLI